MKCQEGELMAAKVVIDQNYPQNFVGACGYFSKQVACIHGHAQLEYKQQRPKKWGIYAINSHSQHGGHGHGCTGNHGSRGHRGAGCGRGRGNTHTINGIDVSDPTRNFTNQEWEALGASNRALVMQMRNHANNPNAGGRGSG